MKFLANENFPLASLKKLQAEGLDIVSVSLDFPSVSDEYVMEFAIKQNRTILTFDRDYGTLIYRQGYRPKAGVIYFRIKDFLPEDPAILLIKLLDVPHFNFVGLFTVIDDNKIRQRKY
jgi:predicted nuclease of predicted toxin-antitoxin system